MLSSLFVFSTGVAVIDARADFDRARRAQRVALAQRRGVPRPPILLAEGPGGYYVVDGRQRVSVARATGRREIEARIA